MALEISAAFPPELDTPDHVVLAEQLGYRRAWLYDSPALYHDVWMTLARAAERTSRIGLGPAVLVPSLRHPMANAAAVATLEDLAPGRVAVAIGAGFTGRHVLGQRALRWADVRAYVIALRALLRGEETEWEGRPIRMIHPPGFGAARPIEVPILLGADGPKGTAVADELGDGTFAAAVPNTSGAGTWRALLQFGTVLDEGEDATSPRVIEAAGPAAAVAIHGLYERAGAAAIEGLPGGPEWRAQTEALDDRTRHLAIHDRHLVGLSDRDRAALTAGLAGMIPAVGLTGSPESIRERVDGLAALGVTELAYQPGTHDVPRDLRTFAAALDLS
ncbi:MAG TPA: LLM class flavin-dependent oxidoreductase [Acidimicrobiales bacterium]|nr:LLM class flavin-dependent oxidoreductase [Acidimicrobiales bacterium]